MVASPSMSMMIAGRPRSWTCLMNCRMRVDLPLPGLPLMITCSKSFEIGMLCWPSWIELRAALRERVDDSSILRDQIDGHSLDSARGRDRRDRDHASITAPRAPRWLRVGPGHCR